MSLESRIKKLEEIVLPSSQEEKILKFIKALDAYFSEPTQENENKIDQAASAFPFYKQLKHEKV